MMSLFFEVEIKPGRTEKYLQLAASLRPELDALGGCLFLDRFKSLSRDNLLLSYQIWQDEGALTAWRAHGHHHEVQTLGRDQIFSDYRIRVAQVIHEARRDRPVWQPERRTAYNNPQRRPPTYVLVTETSGARLPIATDMPVGSFASVYREGRFAHLIELEDDASGLALSPRLLADPATEYVRIVEVTRDYGMYNRREAPQYYPPKAPNA
ncbi:antibiotic biosynthesis monooxygenase family protein [Bradyrhizobium sp. SZCCHNPS2010]|uniref:antibiotic biosynthesis monooxygenase family protein n=1 Tax=Bradyrhizobium sp. SZCCHNPS2010 TaxID=3057333 RepID=UPI002915EF75|nr:antibiotic biosynthesis monooxygenase family protein [Bradyrhizobium sp. SZCCHNPS2010]